MKGKVGSTSARDGLSSQVVKRRIWYGRVGKGRICRIEYGRVGYMKR